MPGRVYSRRFLPKHDVRLPAICLEVTCSVSVEDDAFALEPAPLGLGSCDVAAVRNAPLSVDDTMPWKAELVAETLLQELADGSSCPRTSGMEGDLTVRRDSSLWNLAYEPIDPVFERRQILTNRLELVGVER